MVVILIFIVGLVVIKIFHPRKLMPIIIICESMMMGVATNIVVVHAANTDIPVLASNNSHCYSADSV